MKKKRCRGLAPSAARPMMKMSFYSVTDAMPRTTHTVSALSVCLMGNGFAWSVSTKVPLAVV